MPYKETKAHRIRRLDKAFAEDMALVEAGEGIPLSGPACATYMNLYSGVMDKDLYCPRCGAPLVEGACFTIDCGVVWEDREPEPVPDHLQELLDLMHDRPAPTTGRIIPGKSRRLRRKR